MDYPASFSRRGKCDKAIFLLAFCRFLRYTEDGTVSTLVGGTPALLGVMTLLRPHSHRRGVVRMVTWPDLIEFCSFLVMLIALIVGIIDHNNKK